ncbi:predicted protein [Nematostella vectensis]|uniref:Thioredoxin domain-containing protein n=1 Tax=Nematostella vectensis TaxID=45351 RepID=A7RXF6_NEMVE|nr:thioredoxin-related transmembrane protein 2 [Nematostella vectensis]EDO43837.1 predicted protein [Nematostella vectensis]|eukprot:XP_001635900.1 predicted protein [Nematostella vectensis]
MFWKVKARDLKIILTGHYILNTLAGISYGIVRSFNPFCHWLFPTEDCEMDWRDLELLSFLAIVLAVKNRKLKPASWQEFVSMAFTFSKIANFVLFSRQDLRLGILFFLVCIVLFVIFPEPSYKGPDNIRFFRGPALDDELKENPNVTWIVEFYAPWSPPCVRLAPIFAELSLKYNNDFLKFGKLDAGKYPIVANRYKVDASIISKQLPTVIVFEGGKEIKRKPSVDSRAVISPYTFTEEKMIRDFNIGDLYDVAKKKAARSESLRSEQKKEK